MVRELGVTEEDRSVILTSEDGKVIIEKDTPGNDPGDFLTPAYLPISGAL